MSKVKEIDRLINEIADFLVIHPDMVNLSQVSGGFKADVNMSGHIIAGETKKDSISAMNSLLEICQQSKIS